MGLSPRFTTSHAITAALTRIERARARGDPEDTRELLNYRLALQFVSAWLSDAAPITEALVREIHKKVVTGVRRGSGRVPARAELRRERGHRPNRLHAATCARRTDPDARARRVAEVDSRCR
jgi:Fic family protein